MKYFIGIIIGIFLTLSFQKIIAEPQSSLPTDTPTSELVEKIQIPADFLVFYTQFHSDSLYQIAHINFPLEGQPSYMNPDSVDLSTFRWHQEDWMMHRILDHRKENFIQDLSLLSDNLIVENIPTGDRKLWIQRRFFKSGDEWRLIYYSGLNKRDFGEQESELE